MSSNKTIKYQTMKNFTLKFGKYKGQQFLSTPTHYQNWLLKQDWFKAPIQANDPMIKVQKELSSLRNKLGNWNGYSKKGEAIYDSIFEAEKAMDDAIFNSPNQSSPYYNGDY